MATTRIKVAATEINAFLGADRGTADEVGVSLTDGALGAIIDKSATKSGYAFYGSGNAALVGIDGLTLEGSAIVELNRLGYAIDETITTPTGAVQIKFDEATDVTRFGATATLAVDGFVDLSGSFGFEK